MKKKDRITKVAIILVERIINGPKKKIYPLLINQNEIVKRDSNPHLFYKLGWKNLQNCHDQPLCHLFKKFHDREVDRR